MFYVEKLQKKKKKDEVGAEKTGLAWLIRFEARAGSELEMKVNGATSSFGRSYINSKASITFAVSPAILQDCLAR